MKSPVPPLPERTFRARALVPPILLFGEFRTLIPFCRLARAVEPAALVPMKFP